MGSPGAETQRPKAPRGKRFRAASGVAFERREREAEALRPGHPYPLYLYSYLSIVPPAPQA